MVRHGGMTGEPASSIDAPNVLVAPMRTSGIPCDAYAEELGGELNNEYLTVLTSPSPSSIPIPPMTSSLTLDASISELASDPKSEYTSVLASRPPSPASVPLLAPIATTLKVVAMDSGPFTPQNDILVVSVATHGGASGVHTRITDASHLSTSGAAPPSSTTFDAEDAAGGHDRLTDQGEYCEVLAHPPSPITVPPLGDTETSLNEKMGRPDPVDREQSTETSTKVDVRQAAPEPGWRPSGRYMPPARRAHWQHLEDQRGLVAAYGDEHYTKYREVLGTSNEQDRDPPPSTSKTNVPSPSSDPGQSTGLTSTDKSTSITPVVETLGEDEPSSSRVQILMPYGVAGTSSLPGDAPASNDAMTRASSRALIVDVSQWPTDEVLRKLCFSLLADQLDHDFDEAESAASDGEWAIWAHCKRSALSCGQAIEEMSPRPGTYSRAARRAWDHFQRELEVVPLEFDPLLIAPLPMEMVRYWAYNKLGWLVVPPRSQPRDDSDWYNSSDEEPHTTTREEYPDQIESEYFSESEHHSLWYSRSSGSEETNSVVVSDYYEQSEMEDIQSSSALSAEDEGNSEDADYYSKAGIGRTSRHRADEQADDRTRRVLACWANAQHASMPNDWTAGRAKKRENGQAQGTVGVAT
ncbi:uncharacterized protein B0H18DRAFT_1210549 [Fomitopsis serialis]|uniref:uncharacterized protein n=1 Tax=Fomitopsis serialis TaxID=139415 RepID=UPI0020082BF2|nr:uncharacterized protein B0H18DRAFT_1210549 [Neoantrodia serialis]KAH9927845.1 hypothetical protein B0H18DRAFT_1210549 [Neoantrodia serialis]